MFKKLWVFCTSCGKSYQTTSLKVQFCSKKCINDWINCRNDTHMSKSRSFGQKDKSEYKKWRQYVYKKYDGKCSICNTTESQLHAHHIIKWVDNIDLRYDGENGLLVCRNCHSCIHGHSVGGSIKILKNKNEMKKVREKYIKIAKIKFFIGAFNA